MEQHPRMRSFLRMVKCYRLACKMSDFGGSSPKPTWIYSNFPFIEDLLKFRLPPGTAPERAKDLHCLPRDAHKKIFGYVPFRHLVFGLAFRVEPRRSSGHKP
jgi:hypothetical protein